MTGADVFGLPSRPSFEGRLDLFDPLYRPGDEADFQLRLAQMFTYGFGHQAYLHASHEAAQTGEWPYFRVRKERVYPDLYVRTSPDWEHHGIFPIIAVEAKLADKGMKWVTRHAFEQIKRYNAASEAVYLVDEEPAPRPSIILLATPSSVASPGVLFWWQDPRYRTEREVWAASDAITQLLQRQLQDVGAAVMVGKGFSSNIVGPNGAKGPMRRYELAV